MADRRRHLSEHARLVVEADPQRETERRAWCYRHGPPPLETSPARAGLATNHPSESSTRADALRLRRPVEVGREAVPMMTACPPARALPDRRQQPRLPRVLRAAGLDRDLAGRAHERDLRLREHAREDPHRVRAEGDDRRLGRGHVRARGPLRALQGGAKAAARTCCASSGRTSSRWSSRSATATCASRVRGRRRDREPRRAGQAAGHRRDGRDRRPRRLPARRRRPHADHDHLARHHRHARLRPRRA